MKITPKAYATIGLCIVAGGPFLFSWFQGNPADLDLSKLSQNEICSRTFNEPQLLDTTRRSIFCDPRKQLSADEISGVLSLRLANADDYVRFLTEHLDSGGKIDNVPVNYLAPYPAADYFKATRDAVLPSGPGSPTINVIVPHGVDVRFSNPNESGYSQLLRVGVANPGLTLYPDILEKMRTTRGYAYSVRVNATIKPLNQVRSQPAP